MSVHDELGYASEHLEGAIQALDRAEDRRPDWDEAIGLIKSEVRKARGDLRALINLMRERER